MKRSTVDLMKKVGMALLAVGIIGGTVALGNKMYQDAKSPDKSFNPKLSVGGLVTETGAFENDLTSMYTKDAFKARGLKVKLDIDAQLSYQVFFYDEADVFLSCTEVLTKSGSVEVPQNALARIEIKPVVTAGTAQPQIGNFDCYKYSKNIMVVVDKNQDKIVQPTPVPPKV